MIHPLSPMVMQFALSLINSGNPLYQNRTLEDVIDEVLQNLDTIGMYFSDDEEQDGGGTVH